MSTRLWDGSVPDPPLPAPPRPSGKRPPPNWTLTGPVQPATQQRRSQVAGRKAPGTALAALRSDANPETGPGYGSASENAPARRTGAHKP
jgi:hypothetical protein